MAPKVVDKLILPDDAVVAACCTPFDQNGEVKYSAFEKYADHMVKEGVTGLFVNGTLGEGMSMSCEERKRCLETWKSLQPNRFKTMIAHVTAGSVVETVDLAKHAAGVGVDAVAVMSPTLFKPSSIGNLVAYLNGVAKHVADTPFFYYDINVLTGVVFDTAEVMRQCKEGIANFAGIKYSCRELGNYQCAMMECESGRYKIALGTVDEVFLPWLTLGARVPICHSLMAPIHAKTRAGFLAGKPEEATQSQDRAQRIGILKRSYGADVAVSKAMLDIIGLDMGPPRLPLEELTPEAKNMLKSDMQALNLL